MENADVLMAIPPSGKLVLRVIRERKIARLQELRQETMLPQRTLLYAIKILRELGLIETQVCMNDARRRFYCVKLK
jgi:DNA-binding MarR family transcriptional regulator